MIRSWEHWRAGEPARWLPLAEWRLWDREASLRRAQQRFPEALEAFSHLLKLTPLNRAVYSQISEVDTALRKPEAAIVGRSTVSLFSPVLHPAGSLMAERETIIALLHITRMERITPAGTNGN